MITLTKTPRFQPSFLGCPTVPPEVGPGAYNVNASDSPHTADAGTTAKPVNQLAPFGSFVRKDLGPAETLSKAPLPGPGAYKISGTSALLGGHPARHSSKIGGPSMASRAPRMAPLNSDGQFTFQWPSSIKAPGPGAYLEDHGPNRICYTIHPKQNRTDGTEGRVQGRVVRPAPSFPSIPPNLKRKTNYPHSGTVLNGSNTNPRDQNAAGGGKDQQASETDAAAAFPRLQQANRVKPSALSGAGEDTAGPGHYNVPSQIGGGGGSPSFSFPSSPRQPPFSPSSSSGVPVVSSSSSSGACGGGGGRGGEEGTLQRERGTAPPADSGILGRDIPMPPPEFLHSQQSIKAAAAAVGKDAATEKPNDSAVEEGTARQEKEKDQTAKTRAHPLKRPEYAAAVSATTRTAAFKSASRRFSQPPVQTQVHLPDQPSQQQRKASSAQADPHQTTVIAQPIALTDAQASRPGPGSYNIPPLFLPPDQSRHFALSARRGEAFSFAIGAHSDRGVADSGTLRRAGQMPGPGAYGQNPYPSTVAATAAASASVCAGPNSNRWRWKDTRGEQLLLLNQEGQVPFSQRDQKNRIAQVKKDPRFACVFGVHSPSLALLLKESGGRPFHAFLTTSERECLKQAPDGLPVGGGPEACAGSPAKMTLVQRVQEKARIGVKGPFGSVTDRFHGQRERADEETQPGPGRYDPFPTNAEEPADPTEKPSRAFMPGPHRLKGRNRAPFHKDPFIAFVGKQKGPGPATYSPKLLTEVSYTSPFRQRRVPPPPFGTSDNRDGWAPARAGEEPGPGEYSEALPPPRRKDVSDRVRPFLEDARRFGQPGPRVQAQAVAGLGPAAAQESLKREDTAAVGLYSLAQPLEKKSFNAALNERLPAREFEGHRFESYASAKKRLGAFASASEAAEDPQGGAS
uniref:Uncharacterized protein n=1 Tax=Chromera velia CCMP2878 TaxID=1169474 RepID=A0A0G4FS86_9ALVE|eukprot:Cvel_18400.t1-p1 / transcript=Cvel_18400.t1 / gene=Cvel_18400 / organism=Chromera_velia_CCMP2878 / gene_product=hypothetical protein / transcript_product=hypothetical protein / location=Cvel_scaffold1521:29839-34186(-) / protein_length=910 / sequence_SO=supercontig / SO=protein_coding / is_pseudo=false